jgi:hypothetical protein
MLDLMLNLIPYNIDGLLYSRVGAEAGVTGAGASTKFSPGAGAAISQGPR